MTAVLTPAQTIRALTVKELPLCLPFGEAFIDEKHLPGPFNADVFLRNWTTFLTSYPSVIFGLWKDEELIGGLGGMIFPDLNTGQSIGIEFFWYVGKEYRGSIGSARLVLRFKKWAKERGAVRWRMIHLLDPDETASSVKLAGFYEGVGLKPIEVGYDGLL